MIRPHYRKILLDQRGAAVILWSFFFISVPIYIAIAQRLLHDPALGTNPSIAQPARIFFWVLALIDIGYYFYWRDRKIGAAAIRREARNTKMFRALEDFQGIAEENAAYAVATLVTRKVVIFAIIEALAVYGFVLAFIGRFVADQIVLSLITLVLLTIEFPSAKSFDRLLQSTEGWMSNECS